MLFDSMNEIMFNLIWLNLMQSCVLFSIGGDVLEGESEMLTRKLKNQIIMAYNTNTGKKWLQDIDVCWILATRRMGNIIKTVRRLLPRKHNMNICRCSWRNQHISGTQFDDCQECSEYKWESCEMIMVGDDNLLWD